MENLDRRALRGIKALLVRQVVLQLCSLIGSVVLARLLAPSQFGLFTTVSVSVTLLAFLGEFGLAPSFIQRRAELTDRDLQVGFTIQQVLTTGIVVVLFLSAPWISRIFAKDYPDLTWLVRALACSLYLTTWRSMSALQLERQLRYRRLAWIEVLEQGSYQGVAVGMAVAGFGVWSLIWAVLARGVLGTLLVYLAAPWKIRLAFDWRLCREILAYGIPFQLQLIINSGGIMLPALVVALRVGPQAVGYISWAQNYGNKPLDVVQNVMRVGFSHFSRIQDDREQVERILRRYLLLLLVFSGLWLATVVTAGPAFVQWIFTNKWTPAVPALLLYAVALNFSVLSSVGAVSLNSVGLVKYATQIMVIRTIVNVTLSVALVIQFGYIGVPLAWAAAAALEGVLMFRGFGPGAIARTLLPMTWLFLPLGASVALGLVAAHAPLPLRPRAFITLGVTCAVYAGVVWAMCPQWLREVVRRKVRSLPRHSGGIGLHASGVT
jgi:O-antigen/teichoic acid export membrane protein